MSKDAAARQMTDSGPGSSRDEITEALDRLRAQEPPMAPTEVEWAALSAQERQQVVDSLPAGRTPEERKADQSRVEALVQEMEEQVRNSERRSSIITVLEVRGIPISDDLRERLETCQDAAVLQRALRRAMTCTVADPILDEEVP